MTLTGCELATMLPVRSPLSTSAFLLALGAGAAAACVSFRCCCWRTATVSTMTDGGPLAFEKATNYANFLKSDGRATEDLGEIEKRNSCHASTDVSSGQGLGVRDNGVSILVLYGTEYGFSREVAHKVAADMSFGPFRTNVQDMADYPEGYPLEDEQLVLIVCSTQGDGVPPSAAKDFVEWLERHPNTFQGVLFSVLALGDRSYTHFAACGKQIDAVLELKGAMRCCSRTDVHLEDWQAINDWTESIKERLPLLELKPIRSVQGSAGSNVKLPIRPYYGQRHPFPAVVTSVASLCAVVESGDKETVRVELDLDPDVSGLSYTPGDALGIMPVNRTQEVQELLQVLGVDGMCTVQPPSWYTGTTEGGLDLQHALVHLYDLRRPRPGLLDALLEAKPSDSTESNKLHELVATGPENEERREAYLSARHIVDILRDFSSARLQVPVLLANLRALQPRLYSISSSPLESLGRVQITVAIVRYESLGIERYGVTSSYLGEHTKAGDRVSVYIAKNPDFRLPSDPKLPVIMIGPGTGVAPFRAFVQQRIHESNSSGEAFGKMMLFCGCRHKDRDYLYRGMLESWHRDGIISLHTAFSRDSPQKHKLLENADDVWTLLASGAHVYVCGDATHMARDVEQALLGLISHRLPAGGQVKAEMMLQELRATGRYQKDVW